MTRIGGERRKNRSLFRKGSKAKGKVSHRHYLAEFEVGDKVNLVIEPAVRTGLYLPRFTGKTGTITKRLGTCYEVAIKDFNKAKTLIVHPIHMRKQKI